MLEKIEVLAIESCFQTTFFDTTSMIYFTILWFLCDQLPSSLYFHVKSEILELESSVAFGTGFFTEEVERGGMLSDIYGRHWSG